MLTLGRKGEERERRRRRTRRKRNERHISCGEGKEISCFQ
jgi:hypothetical protein